jgi:hypothetical protein
MSDFGKFNLVEFVKDYFKIDLSVLNKNKWGML